MGQQVYAQSTADLIKSINNKILFKNYKEALANLNRIVGKESIGTYASQAYCLRGKAHAGLKMFKDALADYNMAIQLDPDNVEAIQNKGILLLDNEKLEEALTEFNNAIQKNMTYLDAYMNRGKALFKLNKHALALEDLNKVVKANPSYVDALLLRASIKRGLDDINGALQDCTKAIEEDENATEAYMIRANIRLVLGNPGAAILDLNQALEIEDSNELIYFQLGNTYFSAADFKNAIKFYSKAITFNGKDANFFLQRGLAKQKINDKAGGCADISMAVRLGSIQAEYLKTQTCK